MLGKRQRSVIGKLSEILVSGSRAALFEPPATSPRGPLDLRALGSPRGYKNYDLGGVGLGILAALERSGVADRGGVCRPRVSRTGSALAGSDRSQDCLDDDSENYTYVTCYGPNCQSFTKVYYDGGEYCCGGLAESRPSQEEELPVFPALEFLSSCHSCGKKLQGEDIYMYRGEKAFCSSDCRSSQISIDERKERCRSDASRAANLSNSPYTEGQIFSTGILAA